MGIFSGIFNAVKSFFQKILSSIARFLSDVFGSPLVASMAIFIITFVITGGSGSMLYNILTGTATEVGTSAVAALVMKYATYNLIANAVLAVLPESFSRALGKIAGFIFVVTLALTVAGVYNPGWFGIEVDSTQSYWTQLIQSYEGIVEKLFGAHFLGSAAYNIITSVAATSFALALTNPAFASGLAEGMLVPIEAAADLADGAIDVVSSAASSILLPVALSLGAAYLLLSSLSDSEKIVIQQAASNPDPSPGVEEIKEAGQGGGYDVQGS